jgi:hypothetical protein
VLFEALPDLYICISQGKVNVFLPFVKEKLNLFITLKNMPWHQELFGKKNRRWLRNIIIVQTV